MPSVKANVETEDCVQTRKTSTVLSMWLILTFRDQISDKYNVEIQKRARE